MEVYDPRITNKAAPQKGGISTVFLFDDENGIRRGFFSCYFKKILLQVATISLVGQGPVTNAETTEESRIIAVYASDHQVPAEAPCGNVRAVNYLPWAKHLYVLEHELLRLV